FRIIARPAQSAFSEHIGKYSRAAMRPAEIYRRGAHQFDKSQVYGGHSVVGCGNVGGLPVAVAETSRSVG
ncbi:MAG: hypothetical protein WBR28_05880, partial [Mycobacterium sp.]